MVNKRHSRASRYNTHHSRVQPRSDGHQAFIPSHVNAHHPAAEITPPKPLEERVQQIGDAQNEILQLLREGQQPAHAWGAPPLQNLSTEDRTSAPQLHPEAHRQEAELQDIASSTHSLPAPEQDNKNVPHEDKLNLPDDLLEEWRRLIREGFPAKERNRFLARRKSMKISPFTDAVQQHPIPTGFKLPNIDPYDGTSDPYEHVDHYRTIMHIQRASDALLCQVFPATLKGQARTWFYSLPSGNINSFEELSNTFTEQFIANRRIIKDPSHLSGIRQNEGETLKEYFQRFSQEARQIPGVDPELLRGVFLGGMRPGPFYSSLMRDTVHTYADLIHRIEAQIAADEAISAHRKQFEPQSSKRKNSLNDTAPSLQRSKSKSLRTAGLSPLPPRPDKQFTSLNTSRADILMAIENKGIFKWPKPLKNPSGGDQSQYCHFHRAKGHATENCLHLNEEIERLIQRGYLGQFIQDRVQSSKDGTPIEG